MLESLFPPAGRRARRTRWSLLGPLLAASSLAQEQGPAPELGAWVATRAELHAPAGVAFTPEGDLVVVETGAHRVRVLAPDGSERARLGARGAGAGELCFPGAVAVDERGRIVVADTGNHRVQVYAGDGSLVHAFGGHGAAAGQLLFPAGVAVQGEIIAVADRGNDRVQLFDDRGRLLRIVGAEHLHGPSGVALAGEELLVANTGRHRIEVFSTTGERLRGWGDWGFFPGLFARVSDVVTAGGRVFTCDAENHRVQVFSPAGELLARFGLHAIEPGEGQGKLHYPSALALSADGTRAALAEPMDDRVQIFGPMTEEVDPVDALRMRSTQPAAHYGERLATDGVHLLIVEPETHELLVYDLAWDEPRLIARLGGFGETLGLFDRPLDAELDGLELWIADAGNRALHHARLAIPQADVRFDPEMASWVKRLDFERLGRDFADVPLAFAVEPVAVMRAAQELFVLDGRNERVLVLGLDFAFRRSFGGHGTAPGALRGPTELAFDAQRGLVWVVDAHNGRVQGFDAAGELKAVVGEGVLADPFGACVDGSGRLWVSESDTSELLRFDLGEPGEELLRVAEPSVRFGGPGLGRVRFHRPRGLDVGPAGEIIVLDHGNHRIQWLSAEGEYRGVFGSRLYTKPARLPQAAAPQSR